MPAIYRVLPLLLGMGMAMPAEAALQELGDEALAAVQGQALFVADKISGSAHAGADALSTPFTFYRIGIDGDLALNLNLDKLQLGCGGFNEGVRANSCDVDLDFVRLAGTSNSGGPTSDFVMQRPYLELAVKNDTDKTRREIVGIKIGAELATGLLSIGRVYNNGQVNQEWGGTCNPNYVDLVDNGSRQACHSGANTISGFLNAQLSGRGNVNTPIGSRGVCFGNTTVNTGDRCGVAQTEYATVAGTRMSDLAVRNQTLLMDSDLCVFFICIGEGLADLRENLRFLHTVTLNSQSKDFFLSFQRERLRYPIYNYNAPYDTDGQLPTAAGKNGDTTSRAYHFPANTGWWMNISYAEAMNVYAGTLTIEWADLIPTLTEGANLVNIGLGQIPLKNCFGTLEFC